LQVVRDYFEDVGTPYFKLVHPDQLDYRFDRSSPAVSSSGFCCFVVYQGRDLDLEFKLWFKGWLPSSDWGDLELLG